MNENQKFLLKEFKRLLMSQTNKVTIKTDGEGSIIELKIKI